MNKIRLTTYTVSIMELAEKCSYRSTENANTVCIKQEHWSKRWPLTSIRCSDHLSRQFLTTASTFPYSSKNSSALQTHSHRQTHTQTHTHTHTHARAHARTRTHRDMYKKREYVRLRNFLELYGKVETMVRNCLLRWSGHLVEVAGTPLFDQSFSFKHISLFVHR